MKMNSLFDMLSHKNYLKGLFKAKAIENTNKCCKLHNEL